MLRETIINSITQETIPMSILKFLSGPSLEKLEKKADALFESGAFGQAKIAYERALGKAENERRRMPDAEPRLLEKLGNTMEALAAAHQKTAEDYMEGGYWDDAASYLSLAREMTSDEARTGQLAQLKEKLETLRRAEAKAAAEEEGDAYYGPADDESWQEDLSPDPGEEFHAICAALPPDIREAYLSYDEDFRTGYLALNTGDFEIAATHLGRAAAADSDPGSYIRLELATAFLHLGRLAEARELLLPFLEHHPDALPAYQLLCEIFWEEKDFRQADALIDSVPDTHSESLAVVLLRGETRYHAGDFEAAKALYQTVMDGRGWEQEVALALAKAHEAAGETEEARSIYQDIMGRCTGCRTRIDPDVKHKYAELSFAAGIYDTHILELYLALAQELPHMARDYYARVSRIYSEQGNETEAARFRIIARQASE
jgi:lipopolysaccharide biosynthesis regulator YciM